MTNHLLSSYQAMRARSREIFGLLTDDAYYAQPIDLRHPIVFYDGHLPGFSFNTLVKRALGGASIDAALERLFARGIDPHEQDAGGRRPDWPDRATVRAFVEEADRRVMDALAHEELDRPGHALLDRAEAAHAIIEHEAMHQETLLYMWHRLPYAMKRAPAAYVPQTEGTVPRQEWIEVPAGEATLGVNRGAIPFGWDNEFGAYRCAVDRFSIERHNVTNAAYLEFVEAGGYRDARWWTPDNWAWLQANRITHPLFWENTKDTKDTKDTKGSDDTKDTKGADDENQWFWRGMFARVPLPLAWPVYVSHAEASAYARWRGARLPSEAEFQRAAYGAPDDERRYPWGAEPPTPDHGVFDFASWDPEPAGTHPKGASAWGVDDLVGNGWEWTSSVFAPFPGFAPMASYPEYSADFFDGEHLVMKGASPVTARALLRPTFRNWFRARYPYVYASFRCVKTTP